MVKHFGETVKLEVVAITCNCCRKKFEDQLEIQEFLTWRDTGGYGNRVFGDMTRIELDLCQYCVKNLLGSYVITHRGSIG